MSNPTDEQKVKRILVVGDNSGEQLAKSFRSVSPPERDGELREKIAKLLNVRYGRGKVWSEGKAVCLPVC